MIYGNPHTRAKKRLLFTAAMFPLFVFLAYLGAVFFGHAQFFLKSFLGSYAILLGVLSLIRTIGLIRNYFMESNMRKFSLRMTSPAGAAGIPESWFFLVIYLLAGVFLILLGIYVILSPWVGWQI